MCAPATATTPFICRKRHCYVRHLSHLPHLPPIALRAVTPIQHVFIKLAPLNPTSLKTHPPFFINLTDRHLLSNLRQLRTPIYTTLYVFRLTSPHENPFHYSLFSSFTLISSNTIYTNNLSSHSAPYSPVLHTYISFATPHINMISQQLNQLHQF